VGDQLSFAIGDALSKANQSVFDQQWVDVFVPGGGVDLRPAFSLPMSCDLTGAANSCETERNFFANALVHDGATQLGYGNPSAEMTRLMSSAKDAHNWGCLRVGSESHCKFRVPTKRLLLFPDAAEAVFFDGPLTGVNAAELGDLTIPTALGNPAYAFYVGLNAPLITTFAPGSVNLMCAYQPTPPGMKNPPSHPWISIQGP
jgi:hypothetical protein